MQVYECNQGGTPTFSDMPCGDHGAGAAQPVEVDYSTPDAAQSRAALESVAAEEEQASAVAEPSVLDAEILGLEQRIKGLEMERDARLSALRRQIAKGTELTDTASWESKMYQQIDGLTADYNETILTEQTHLDELKAQRQSLRGQGYQSGPAR